MLLADFGADVIKVEDTGMGDYVRWSPPYYDGAEQTARGALFLALNRGKRSIRIDLKTDEGKDVLLRLVRDADVLLESFRPGVLDRLGVGYERLREVNPGLVYCAITGYGQDGPNRDRSGHDMNYLGLGGLLGLTGDPDGVPVQAAGQIADLGGGALMGAIGVLTALRERERSGEGQLVDCSMFDGALSWLALVAAEAFAPSGRMLRRGQLPLAGALTCYRPYACADGFVTLGALEPKFWAAFCRGVDREDLTEHAFDPPGSDAHKAVTEIFAARTRAQWHEFASQHDCCLEPVLDLDEALESEQVRAREMVVEIDQPGAEHPVKLLGAPIKLSRTPADPTRPGPALGEHTDEVLAAAGYTADEIAAFHGQARSLARPQRSKARSWADEQRQRHDRHAQDLGARRALGRVRRHDQALPPRGSAWLRRRGRAHLAEHGLLPARVRRPHPADQAVAGGAVHAAAGDPRRDGGRPRPRVADDRARGPHPRARDRREGDAAGCHGRRSETPTTSPRTCSPGSRSSAC